MEALSGVAPSVPDDSMGGGCSWGKHGFGVLPFLGPWLNLVGPHLAFIL